MTTQTTPLARAFRFLSSQFQCRKPARAVSLGASVFVSLMATSTRTAAQGCIASPNNPCSVLIPGDFTENMSMAHKWIASVDYRFYESFRHFVGDVEQPQRIQLGNNVINDVHTFDVTATYGFSDRWTATALIPFTYADRSSLYEHDFVHRHTMHSGSLGDIRVVSDFWLLDPHEDMEGNIALGAGVKLPTGDDHASDTSFRADGPVTRPVDPSVQPGDGGWGIILELQGFQKVYGNLFAYVQGSYTLTPQEQNDTELTIADIPKYAAALTPLRTHDSIPDQYFGRGGLSYVVLPKHGLTLSVGGRIEGVPA